VNSPLLTPPQAATFLSVKTQTLSSWRWSGKGPIFHKIGGARRGAVRYAPADLEAYLAASRQVA